MLKFDFENGWLKYKDVVLGAIDVKDKLHQDFLTTREEFIKLTMADEHISEDRADLDLYTATAKSLVEVENAVKGSK